MSEIDHKHRDDIVCPWCGWENPDSWEAGLNEDGDSLTLECGACEKEFDATMSIGVTYSTSKARCPEGGCDYRLAYEGHDNPYIHSGKNWCIWQCQKCDYLLMRSGPAKPEHAPAPYVIEVGEQTKWKRMS